MPPVRSTVPPELADHPQYHNVRELGRGGMGVVYLATNRLMDRPEVLKVVSRQHLARTGAADRFLREIRAAAKLQHPNVVSAYSAIEVGDLLVFAMEYVPGQDLARVVQANGPLPVSLACRYAAQAAAGLQHAFEKGMAHRDVKPSNLILYQDGGKTTVKVCDFGLAKATAADSDDADLTGAGRLLGTPEYLAPEQAADAARADHRADIYGLGCTLYFLLTARPPFRADGLLALIDAHRYEAAVSLDQVRGDVPAELAAVVARMLAKDPGARFQTPGEVVRALAPFAKPGAPTPVVRPADTIPPADTAPKLPAVARPPSRPATIVGHDLPVPARTAYLNPEDFDPPKKKPTAARPKRKAKPTRDLTPMIVAGVLAVVGLAAAVGFAVVRLRQPGDDTATLNEPAAGPPTPVTPIPPAVPASGGSAAGGFVTLFNGRDLDGWFVETGDAAQWAVENGELVGRSPNGVSTRSHLLTHREYADFVLRFEYNIEPNGNGSVDLRAVAGERMPYKSGTMADHPYLKLTDPAPASAANYPTGAAYWLENDQPNGRQVRSPPDLSAGVWHSVEVTVRGDACTATFDGVQLTDARLKRDKDYGGFTPGLGRAKGKIGFLAHTGALRVRNVQIRDLSAPAATTARGDGFTPLFNGRDLTGWHPLPGQPNNWRVDGGVLVARGGGSRSHLISDGVLGDFHLRAEVRVNRAGNSGIFVRTGDRASKTGSPDDGYEVQINYSGDNGPPTGSIYAGNAVVARLDTAAGRPDEWVQYEVVAVGDRLAVRVNGATAVEYTDPVRRFARGRIGLQQLTPETVVEVRSVEVKELAAWPSAVASAPPPPPAPPAGTLVPPDVGRRRAAERNHGYKTNGKAIYRVEGKDLVLDGSAGNFAWLFFGDPEWTDYDFSARVRDVRGLNGGTLFVRANHEYTGGRQSNGAPATVLRAGLFPFGFAGNTAIAIEGYASLGGFLSGEKYGLPRANFPSVLRANTWHTVRVRVRGKTVETYFDGRPIHRAEPPMPARGMVGIRVVDSGAMRFTDLKVTDPAGKVLWQGLPDLPE